MEKRIRDYQAKNGQVLFGGHLRSETGDGTFAVPNDIGLSLPNPYGSGLVR